MTQTGMTQAERIALNIAVAKALGATATPRTDDEGWRIAGFPYDDTDVDLAWRQHARFNDYTKDPMLIIEVIAALISRYGGFSLQEPAPGTFVCWPYALQQHRGHGETAAEALCRCLVAATEGKDGLPRD